MSLDATFPHYTKNWVSFGGLVTYFVNLSHLVTLWFKLWYKLSDHLVCQLLYYWMDFSSMPQI